MAGVAVGIPSGACPLHSQPVRSSTRALGFYVHSLEVIRTVPLFRR